MEQAQSSAQQGDIPYAIFFCNEEVAKFAGEGTKALLAYRRTAKGRIAPVSVFENLSVVNAVKKAGMPLTRVAIGSDSVELCKKFRVAADPTLVICAPGGQMLAAMAGSQCSQQVVLKLLASLKENYESWKAVQPAKK